MMTSTLIRQAWWKLLLLSLLSAWLSVINIWFGSTFFVAVAFGVIIGHIVFHTLYDGGVPRSRRYLIGSAGTVLVCIYLHFAFYTSLNYLENMIFPWQIWTALKAIAQTGSDVGGYVIPGNVDFHGTGYYTQWGIESFMTFISAVATTHLKL